MVAFGSRVLSEITSRDVRSTGEQGHMAFLLSHGFMARMVLRSGVARQLVEQGIRVMAISPNADEPYFQDECRQEGITLWPEFQNNVSVYTGVELEDDVFCGPSCVFTNVVNSRAQIVRHHRFARTLVRRSVAIRANATIVWGVCAVQAACKNGGDTLGYTGTR